MKVKPELFGSCSCASRSLSWLSPDPRKGRRWSRSSPGLGMNSDSAITTGVMSGKSIHLSEPFPHFKQGLIMRVYDGTQHSGFVHR